MKGLLDPEYEEKVIGQVEVRTTFKVSKIGTIAGSYVTEGKVTRDSQVRLIRDGIVIYEGEIDTLKRYKDDVKEVNQGYECGITLKNYNDIKEGDIIEVYRMEEVARK
jgi:translation initiation factor IF-2